MHRMTLGKMQNPVRGFIHGGAAVAAIVGTIFLLFRTPTWPARIAIIVFGLGFVALYLTSSLYHAVPWREAWNDRMQRADHSMIFVLIAASYTPILAILFEGSVRWAALAVVWGIAAVGIGQKVLFPKVHMAFSITLMVTMGWLGLSIMWPLAERAGLSAAILALAGGTLYTVGMVFLVTGWPRLWPRVFSHHEVFHVFTVLAGALHFAMVWRYIVPLAA
ncbi:MAG: hemolysin III family protein [Acidimicrobiia bacterium]|nr:hemolysin III family protein [Acidimicrobiia bacterium]NNC74929.1 hypothetical protein [Acidimicrobiia bacterium]